MKILVAEDEDTSRLVIEKLLKPYGEVMVVENGQKAVDAFVNAIDKGEPFDLLCLDILMPELDGHLVLKKCREIEQEKNIDLGDGIKIIMTTAMEDKGNVMSSFKEGCESYIIKPITKSNLSKTINKLNMTIN